ncbi:MAG: 2-phospho-L-lactate guanylyltransferase [Nitrososphaerales archaeon]
MVIYCIIPLKSKRKVKLRLSSVLNLDERIKLTLYMLEDILEVLQSSKIIKKLFIVTPDKDFSEFFKGYKNVEVLKEERDEGVNLAVRKANKVCMEDNAIGSLVIPSDIPLISEKELKIIEDFLEGVIISPSLRLDGTNLLLRIPPNSIPTYYDNNSFYNHLNASLKKKISTKIFLSRNLCLDIDSIEDVKEFLSIKVDKKSYHYLSRILGREIV